jgi:hypothetical protein
MSRKWKLAMTAAAAIAVIPAAGVLAQGFGGDDAPGQGPLPGVATAAVQPVGAGAVSAPGAAANASKSIGLSYVQTKGQTVPAGRSSLKIGPTPKGCRAINGYYFIPGEKRTKIASEGDSLAGYRHWIFYRNNRSGDKVKRVVYGVVCIKGAKLIG